MIGWPGRLCHNHLVQRCCDRLARQRSNDARVLSDSKIFEKGNNNRHTFPTERRGRISGQKMNPVIIGDAAHPLLPWLMKPYPENNTTPRIKKKTRSIRG